MNWTTSRRWLQVAAVAVLVTGCGGGGGGDDSGSNSNPPPSGNSSKTVFVTGAITGFGSVIVNGVHYETDSASVTIEDRAASALDLEVGEVVRLKATVDAQGAAHAQSIDQDHLIQGVVQSVDAVAGTLTIAGQVIAIGDDTMFDDSIPTRSLAGIAVGDVLEVHGFASPDGARATRIEKADAGDSEIEVTGVVANLDTAATRFSVGTLVVDYSGATLEDFGTGGLAAGQVVEVKGDSFLPDGALRATRVEREDHDFDGRSGDESEVEGLVTRFVSATDFDVAGQKVTTTAATTFVNGTAADLAADVKVEVEGTLDATDTLVATKVSFEHRAGIRLSGPVDSVDAAAGTFTALGVTVVVSMSTMREDHEGDEHFFSLDDLRAGDWVEVSGYPESGTARLVATRLERDDPENEVEVRGPASDLTASSLKVFGVGVELTAGTEFEDGDTHISADEFLARAEGSTVDAEGTWNGSAIVADKVEIEHEDHR